MAIMVFKRVSLAVVLLSFLPRCGSLACCCKKISNRSRNFSSERNVSNDPNVRSDHNVTLAEGEAEAEEVSSTSVYVVQWTDYHSIEEHESLLTNALGMGPGRRAGPLCDPLSSYGGGTNGSIGDVGVKGGSTVFEKSASLDFGLDSNNNNNNNNNNQDKDTRHGDDCSALCYNNQNETRNKPLGQLYIDRSKQCPSKHSSNNGNLRCGNEQIRQSGSSPATPPYRWNLIPRKNPATKIFPSDFSILEMRVSSCSSAHYALGGDQCKERATASANVERCGPSESSQGREDGLCTEGSKDGFENGEANGFGTRDGFHCCPDSNEIDCADYSDCAYDADRGYFAECIDRAESSCNDGGKEKTEQQSRVLQDMLALLRRNPLVKSVYQDQAIRSRAPSATAALTITDDQNDQEQQAADPEPENETRDTRIHIGKKHVSVAEPTPTVTAEHQIADLRRSIPNGGQTTTFHPLPAQHVLLEKSKDCSPSEDSAKIPAGVWYDDRNKFPGEQSSKLPAGGSYDDDGSNFPAYPGTGSPFDRTERRRTVKEMRWSLESGGMLRGLPPKFVDAAREANWLHERGFLGSGIRVAVFDTGLDAGGHDFDNVMEQINWTNEDTLKDFIGHGTHVAGVIAGRDAKCLGFAPEADLYIFRMFSSDQVSYTSWFLDAFNYAMFLGIDIINLSIGGPDFRDEPFVDKIREVSANGILVVSAVGNDGPLFGTQHNPADQADTIGVGALTPEGDNVAHFQSRGMTTWELPDGFGRVKPDIIATGQHVLGPKGGGTNGECSGLTGTSVASPVVAGAAALLASTVEPAKRRNLVNPASMKQVLVESARKVTGGAGAGVFEQGAGALDVVAAFHLLSSYTPRASLLPPTLNLTDPYMWPYSRQPLFHGGKPAVFNVTVANGMGVTGYIRGVSYTEDRSSRGYYDDVDMLDVQVEYDPVLWPWSGYLAISLGVPRAASGFEGVVTGMVQVLVESDPGPGETQLRSSNIHLPIVVNVAATPPRQKRLLWDQFHSVSYPSAYTPRDYLGDDSDMLDRHGDHPYTNFRSLFNKLLDAGYYVDVLGSDWTCFEAEDYGALLMVDLEDEMGEKEKRKLENDVKEKGLSLVIFADWYSREQMAQVHFVDDNTRARWEPVTGGSNVPALNDFLWPSFGMALGKMVMDGIFKLRERHVHLASGNAIARMPLGGHMVTAPSLEGVATLRRDGSVLSPGTIHRDVVLIGALDTNSIPRPDPRRFRSHLELRTRQWKSDLTDIVSPEDRPESVVTRGSGGRLFLFGDSSCADDAAIADLREKDSDCLWMFESAVRYACEGIKDSSLFADAKEVFIDPGSMQGYSNGSPLPARTKTNELFKYSRVIGPDGADLRRSRHLRCSTRKWEPVRFAASS